MDLSEARRKRHWEGEELGREAAWMDWIWVRLMVGAGGNERIPRWGMSAAAAAAGRIPRN